MLVLLTLVACFGEPRVDPLAVVLPFDAEAVAGPTADLVGWSFEAGTRWGLAEDPVHPEWRSSARVAAVDVLAGIAQGERAPWVRLSGMNTDGRGGADGYHVDTWADARLWGERGPAADDALAPAQALDLAETLGAQVIVPLNLATGTPAEAASYARHLVGQDERRQSWGHAEPWTVRYYELGDEVYDAHTTKWDGDVAAYRDLALAVVDAVLAEDPTATFLVPLTRADEQAWGDVAAAVHTLAPLLEHPAVVGVARHHLQVDDASALGNVNANAPTIALASSAYFAAHQTGLADALAGLNRAEPLQTVISAYGFAGPDVAADFSLGRTAAAGLATADMLIGFANSDAEVVLQRTSLSWDTQEPDPLLAWDRPVRFGEGGLPLDMPSTLVTRMFAECALDQRLDLAWQGNESQRGGDGSDSAPLFNFERIHSAGFVSDDGSQACLFILNRDLADGAILRVNVDSEWVLVQDKAWVPGDNWATLDDPDVAVTGPGWRRFTTGMDLDLPAHALVALHFER